MVTGHYMCDGDVESRFYVRATAPVAVTRAMNGPGCLASPADGGNGKSASGANEHTWSLTNPALREPRVVNLHERPAPEATVVVDRPTHSDND